MMLLMLWFCHMGKYGSVWRVSVVCHQGAKSSLKASHTV